ncbi:hypothetical protein IWW36_000525 [Coemansia brasiliensis]|uniref:GATA-type domain-containing protein n=1 Tax=Coemansia brasiliensis TaxID=2650707 RepID=A0A9W8IDC8_9FUNG|nr:hypothetical protein IWW36_000525 [Coemansia brasiliensis]
MDLNLVCGPAQAPQAVDSTASAPDYSEAAAADTMVSPPPSAKQAEFSKDEGLKASDEKKSGKSVLDKYRNELREVAEKCKVLSQFAEQYGPERNKFNAQPSDDLVIDMARKAYEVLMVFMTIRRERMSVSADNDTMEYIRKRRTVLSPARSKTRKRSRADAAQPNSCRSCGISETPEWRRGPDGARTLCNACGLHYAKLNKKRATEATHHPVAGAGSSDAQDKADGESSAPLSAPAALQAAGNDKPIGHAPSQHGFAPALPQIVHQHQNRILEYPYHPAANPSSSFGHRHAHMHPLPPYHPAAPRSFSWQQPHPAQYYQQQQQQQQQQQPSMIRSLVNQSEPGRPVYSEYLPQSSQHGSSQYDSAPSNRAQDSQNDAPPLPKPARISSISRILG